MSKFLNTSKAYLQVSRKSKLESTTSRKDEEDNSTDVVSSSSKSFGVVSSWQLRVTSNPNISSKLRSPSSLSSNAEFVSLKMSRLSLELKSISRKNLAASLISGRESTCALENTANAQLESERHVEYEYEQHEYECEYEESPPLVLAPSANISLRPGVTNSLRGQNVIPFQHGASYRERKPSDTSR